MINNNKWGKLWIQLMPLSDNHKKVILKYHNKFTLIGKVLIQIIHMIIYTKNYTNTLIDNNNNNIENI